MEDDTGFYLETNCVGERKDNDEYEVTSEVTLKLYTFIAFAVKNNYQRVL